jgi:hypothetical protein
MKSRDGCKRGEIVVMAEFDGGNPQCSSDIVKVDDTTFRIYPYSEDCDDNYMFRVDIKVCSSHLQTKQITLLMEWRAWQAERYMADRDTFFCKHEDGEWELVRGSVEKNVTTLRLKVQPGETMVCMNASYNYDALQGYIRSLHGNPFVTTAIAGFSQENRNIWCLELTDDKVPEERKIKLMMITRVHPYETASSYCAESIIAHLLSEDPSVKGMMAKFIFYMIPMPNPDGVYNGLCKLTRVNGFDFSHGNILTCRDRAGRTLLDLARQIRPQFVLDIHSLMDRERDQIGSSDERLLRAFMEAMPDQVDVGRRWTILLRRYEAPAEPPDERLHYSFTSYCVEELGATSFVLGFSWFDRSFEKMEWTAIKAFNVLTAAIMRTRAEGPT